MFPISQELIAEIILCDLFFIHLKITVTERERESEKEINRDKRSSFCWFTREIVAMLERDQTKPRSFF